MSEKPKISMKKKDKKKDPKLGMPPPTPEPVKEKKPCISNQRLLELSSPRTPGSGRRGPLVPNWDEDGYLKIQRENEEPIPEPEPQPQSFVSNGSRAILGKKSYPSLLKRSASVSRIDTMRIQQSDESQKKKVVTSNQLVEFERRQQSYREHKTEAMKPSQPEKVPSYLSDRTKHLVHRARTRANSVAPSRSVISSFSYRPDLSLTKSRMPQESSLTAQITFDMKAAKINAMAIELEQQEIAKCPFYPDVSKTARARDSAAKNRSEIEKKKQAKQTIVLQEAQIAESPPAIKRRRPRELPERTKQLGQILNQSRDPAELREKQARLQAGRPPPRSPPKSPQKSPTPAPMAKDKRRSKSVQNRATKH